MNIFTSIKEVLKMYKHLVKKYRGMFLASVFFFYLGCGITLTSVHMDCAERENPPTSTDNEVVSDYIQYAVLIMSSPTNQARRDAIRSTWCQLIDNIYVDEGVKLYRWNHTFPKLPGQIDIAKCYFAVSRRDLNDTLLTLLYDENEAHKDLIFLDYFVDNYKNLAVKLAGSITWIYENHKNVEYIIKCDDDSFVRVDLIIKDIEEFARDMISPAIQQYVSGSPKNPASYRGLYWGYFNGKAKVYLSGKWQEKDWFLCDHYLPYALGGGYVISRYIMEYIAKNSDYLSFYNSEDVSMGVWTAALTSINRVHDIRFDTEWKSRGCKNYMLIRHKQSISEMQYTYGFLAHTKGERLCVAETTDRKPYSYKWNVLPGNCCT